MRRRRLNRTLLSAGDQAGSLQRIREVRDSTDELTVVVRAVLNVGNQI